VSSDRRSSLSELILFKRRSDERGIIIQGEFTQEEEQIELQPSLAKTFASIIQDWKHKGDIEPKENPNLIPKYIYLIRKKLPKGFIESDGFGRYRLNCKVQTFTAFEILEVPKALELRLSR
jgi:hypothetical protein